MHISEVGVDMRNVSFLTIIIIFFITMFIGVIISFRLLFLIFSVLTLLLVLSALPSEKSEEYEKNIRRNTYLMIAWAVINIAISIFNVYFWSNPTFFYYETGEMILIAVVIGMVISWAMTFRYFGKIPSKQALMEEEIFVEEQREESFTDEEMLAILPEINKLNALVDISYLFTIPAKEYMAKILKAKYRQGKYIEDAKSHKGQAKFKTDELFREHLNIFTDIITDKGINLIYKEDVFINVLIKESTRITVTNNYRSHGKHFEKLDNKKDIVFKYIEIFGESSAFYIKKLAFLSVLLYNKKVTDHILTIEAICSEVEEAIAQYHYEIKKENYKKKLDGKLKEATINMSAIDRFTGEQFEKFLKDLFSRLGYAVEITKATADQGVDLLLLKNVETTAVQAKCYSSSVGNSAVQEVVAGKSFYNADKTMVVTNNYFTSSAKELAASNNVILWDRDKLDEMIKLVY